MTGPLARSLYISNSRLIEAMEWLKTLGIIEKIDYPIRGVALLEIKFPDIFASEKEQELYG